MKAVVCLGFCASLLWSAEPAERIFSNAARALAAGNYAAAERGFQSVLRDQPRHVGALGNLGVIYSRTNRADQAITAYRRALRLSPDDKAILLNLGLVYLRQEAHRRALPLFERVVALDPGHEQARQLLAVCRLYAGELPPAIRDLEALSAARQEDSQILFLLGFAYLKNHNTEKAKATFEQMFKAAGPVRAEFMLGQANYEAAMFPQAEESFLNVLHRDPNFPGAHLELAKVYISQRRTDDAIRELQVALKENPGGEASYFLGGLLVQQTRYNEGIPYLEQAKKLKPDSWAVYFYLGKAKLRLEEPAEAVTLLQRAVALNPDEASAYYHLGRALAACGRREEADRALRRVRELKASALNAVMLKDDQVAGTR